MRFSWCFPLVWGCNVCVLVYFLLDEMFTNYKNQRLPGHCSISSVFSSQDWFFCPVPRQNLTASSSIWRSLQGSQRDTLCQEVQWQEKESWVQIGRGEIWVRMLGRNLLLWEWWEAWRGVSGRLWMIQAWDCSSLGWVRAHLNLKYQPRHYVLTCPGPETPPQAQENPFH